MSNFIDAISRRQFLGASLAVATTLSTGASAVEADSLTGRYPDQRFKSLDPRFAGLTIGNTPLLRIATGNLWAEGPAWSGVGRYLVWSDIPANVQRRWIEDDGNVSVFRSPSGKTNGNTFDTAGRQVSCQHFHRRVIRFEHDGSETVLADSYQGKPFNAPNDVVVHPDGSIWFTDPGYGLNHYEGQPGEAELKEAVYRIDADGGLTLLTDEVYKPNGLCFSPDYSKLYVADTGTAPGSNDPLEILAWDIDGERLSKRTTFAKMALENGLRGGADGIRADTDGRIWAGAGWGGEGFDGVHVFAPDGDRIGQILLPEICSNLCFGGKNRNRLFMTASQSVYAVYVGVQGAHWA